MNVQVIIPSNISQSLPEYQSDLLGLLRDYSNESFNAFGEKLTGRRIFDEMVGIGSGCPYSISQSGIAFSGEKWNQALEEITGVDLYYFSDRNLLAFVTAQGYAAVVDLDASPKSQPMIYYRNPEFTYNWTLCSHHNREYSASDLARLTEKKLWHNIGEGRVNEALAFVDGMFSRPPYQVDSNDTTPITVSLAYKKPTLGADITFRL